MKSLYTLITAIALATSAGVALAQTAPPGNSASAPKKSDLIENKSTERGWFFFEDPPKKEEELKEEKPKVPPPKEANGLPPPPKEESCTKKESWAPNCGFVDPGEDFEFQEKQRDEILKHMAMSKNNPKAVEAFQYYMRWVMDRASEIGNFWMYNAVQNPDLDPSVKAPVSTFGLKLVSDVSDVNDKKVFNILKEDGAFFLFFSKSDCAFCHHMKNPLDSLSSMTGLEIKNVSLDSKCLEFIKGECMVSPNGDKAAQALNIRIVPTLFLYIRPNTWIRIGTGVVDATTMKNRAVQFFSAYKKALTLGVSNYSGATPSVSFSDIRPSGVQSTEIPSQEDIEKQLGKKK